MWNRVDAYYREILDRAPTAGERAAGAALIRSDDERAIRQQLLASDEAFDEFFAASSR